jgi:hypothetical protein
MIVATTMQLDLSELVYDIYIYILILNMLHDVDIYCRRFETGGPLGRRVSVAACPSPDGSSARASAKGGEQGGRRPA